MATLYYPDGTIIEDVEPENERKGFQLNELYKLLNCDMVEIVHLPNREIMIVDEEGWLKQNAEYNELASSIAGVDIAGRALVCKAKQFK